MANCIRKEVWCGYAHQWSARMLEGNYIFLGLVPTRLCDEYRLLSTALSIHSPPRKRLVVHFNRVKLCPPDITITNYSTQPRQSRPLHSSSVADKYDITLVPFPEVSTLPNTPHSTITNSPSTYQV